jgi:hypothetical protein
MVLFRGYNPTGPANRDERGAYEEMDQRLEKYMVMDDEEWKDLYTKMYNDRKYPGQDNLKIMLFPALVYTGLCITFGFELYLRRANIFNFKPNLLKVVLIPVLGILTFRNIDISLDIIRYRNKYPEMYQV